MKYDSIIVVFGCQWEAGVAGEFGQEDVHEIETTSLIVGILTLILCLAALAIIGTTRSSNIAVDK